MGEWQNGLFGCFSNCGVCIITYFLPCITAGQNAEKVGESCCLYGFLSILGPIGIYTRAKIRGKVREQKGIDVSIFLSILITLRVILITVRVNLLKLFFYELLAC